MLTAKSHSQLLCQTPWRTLIDSFPYPAALTNSRHRFLYINPAFERFYGKKLEEMVGISPWVLMPRTQDSVPIAQMRKALNSRTAMWAGSLTNVDASGKAVRIHLVAFGLRGGRSGPPVAYLSMVAPEADGPTLLPALAQHLGENWLRQAATMKTELPISQDGRGERQEEIMRLTRMGYSTKEIATFMGIATSTVANVKWKLNRRAAVRRKR